MGLFEDMSLFEGSDFGSSGPKKTGGGAALNFLGDYSCDYSADPVPGQDGPPCRRWVAAVPPHLPPCFGAALPLLALPDPGVSSDIASGASEELFPAWAALRRRLVGEYAARQRLAEASGKWTGGVHLKNKIKRRRNSGRSEEESVVCKIQVDARFNSPPLLYHIPLI